jgi:predicted secreted protein
MNTARDAILLGTRGATDTHTGFQIRSRLESDGGSVDVFGTIRELGVPLLFRPLDGLLGACIRLPGAGAGILVTTLRDLHMQRFTAAHELGHFVLEHEGSLDREIGYPGQTKNRDLQEVAADAFAAEFLMPKWLFIHHARRHGWTKEQLHDPAHVYQLSLRMAVSYEATCFGLQAHKILDRTVVDALRKVAPKKTKQRLLGNATLKDSWADVWLLDEHDNGGTIEAGPRDVFVVNLTERAGSGYLWDPHSFENAGFKIEEDSCEPDDLESVGGPTRRRLVLKAPAQGARQVDVLERRPWEEEGKGIGSFSISISTYGAEIDGLPRRSRPSFEQTAVH